MNEKDPEIMVDFAIRDLMSATTTLITISQTHSTFVARQSEDIGLAHEVLGRLLAKTKHDTHAL